MYEIRAIVKNPKLWDALRALQPYAHEHPVVIPVDDMEEAEAVPVAKPVKNGAAPKARKVPNNTKARNGGKNVVELVLDQLKSERPAQITAKQVRELVTEFGCDPTSYFYPVQKLMQRGILSKADPSNPRGGIYNVHLPAETAHEGPSLTNAA